jgi:hypothetical protein
MSPSRIVAALLLLSAPALASAAPFYWAANGHWYDYIDDSTVDPDYLERPGDFTWTAARADSATRTYNGLQGYMVTITSKAEEDFLYSIPLLREKILYTDPWIGAFRTAGSNPVTGWQWVTGEAFSYSNWRAGEPNNTAPAESELYVHYLSTGVGGSSEVSGWNDHPDAIRAPRGYLIEYSAPEPATLALLGLGLAGAAFARRRRRR